MALYAVRNKASGNIRLVDADNQAQALRHVAGDEYAVTIPKSREVAKLVADGVKVEDYGADPEPPAPPPVREVKDGFGPAVTTEQKGQG